MKEFTLKFRIEDNFTGLHVGMEYKKNEILNWEKQYKVPHTFEDIITNWRTLFTANYNIYIKPLFTKINLAFTNNRYVLDKMEIFWEGENKWIKVVFIVAGSMIINAGAVAMYQQKKADIVISNNLIICNDNSLACVGTIDPNAKSKTQLKKAAKRFAQEQRKKWKKEQLAKEIANATEGVVEVLPKLTKEYKTDKLGWWKVEANNISSGTFVGKFTDNQFKVSEQEKIRRLKTVYEFLKQYENEDWKINAKFLSIQWAYETNWGQSKLSNLAANCGGMKTFDKSEPFVYADDDGQDLESNGHSMFKKFYSIEDGLRYWVGEFYQKRLYDQARNNYKDFNAFGYSIQHLYFDKKHNRWVRYAENPNYLTTISKIYQRNEKHLI